MKSVLIQGIRFYQWVSRHMMSGNPFFVPVSGCRSWPTCSEYAVQAIETRGPIRGSGAALMRFLRCSPFVPLGKTTHS
ncbi:MAG: membrane protein insertion efficiency factor YidD [Candidatus Yanofskybacteria bacterium]|nr:membrane protein insertion efficiency factor YidD [Candidatus Yanofskybacteria bacterium]